MSPVGAGGKIPARLFRGSDMPQEVQIENVRKAFSAIGSANVLPGGIMPAQTIAGSGTEIATSGANVAWFFTTVTASAVQNVTFTHGLGRTPAAILLPLATTSFPQLAATAITDWNSTAAAVRHFSATAATFTIILL